MQAPHFLVSAEVAARLPEGAVIATRYQHLPLVRVKATSGAGLSALAALHAEQERAFAPQLAQSLPLIGEPAVAAKGMRGEGATVVVADGPIDLKNPAFGRCAAGELGAPGCKLAAAVRLAQGDASSISNQHATNVSAIALGVAPGARVAALDVMSSDGKAYTGDLLAAIDWAIEHQAEFNIAAINLSLGAGAYDKPCADDALAQAIAWAQVAGIVTTVASGNDGHPNQIASPACAPAAVSVGAVYSAATGRVDFGGCEETGGKADGVACFSNSAPFLTLLAPGALITAGGITMAGTSQAAPHVAGAVAVLRAAFPHEDVAETIARLRRSSASVTDPRSGRSLPRLDLVAATADATAEVALGALQISGTGHDVTLSFDQLGPSPLTAVCLSEDLVCLGGFTAIAQSTRFHLSAGAGVKTIRAWFRDARGIESVTPASATVRVD